MGIEEDILGNYCNNSFNDTKKVVSPNNPKKVALWSPIRPHRG
jgi:hypothetical protein